MTQLNTNQVLGLIIALVAVGYLVMAFQIPSFPLPRPIDSDLFPKVLGFTLLGLAVLLFLEKPKDQDVPDEIEPEERPGHSCCAHGHALLLLHSLLLLIPCC